MSHRNFLFINIDIVGKLWFFIEKILSIYSARLSRLTPPRLWYFHMANAKQIAFSPSPRSSSKLDSIHQAALKKAFRKLDKILMIWQRRRRSWAGQKGDEDESVGIYWRLFWHNFKRRLIYSTSGQSEHEHSEWSRQHKSEKRKEKSASERKEMENFKKNLSILVRFAREIAFSRRVITFEAISDIGRRRNNCVGREEIWS